MCQDGLSLTRERGTEEVGGSTQLLVDIPALEVKLESIVAAIVMDGVRGCVCVCVCPAYKKK